MDILAQLPQIPFPVLANYVTLGMAGVSVTFILLSGVFSYRYTPAIYYTYFLLKNIVDAMLWYAIEPGGAGALVMQLQQLWSGTLAVVSMLVMWLTFVGELPSVIVCAILCDLIASICISGSSTLANLACGTSTANTNYLDVFGPHTILTAAILIVVVWVVRKPWRWLLRWLCRVTQRFHDALVMAISLVATLLIVSSQARINYTNPYTHLTSILPYLIAMAALIGFSITWRARQARARETAMSETSALVASYDGMVREQLAALEDELLALDGHEEALLRLGSSPGSAVRSDVLTVRANELRRVYKTLSSGAYCDRPALDAVFSMFAKRLSELGVLCSFTVAGVPVNSVIPATIAFALLNLAAEAADRAGTAQGDTVELRVRGVGEHVLFRMEVPASWGVLWVRRLLGTYREQTNIIVRERTKKGRTVALVLCGNISMDSQLLPAV